MIHLHVHDSSSLLDGAIRIDKLVDKVIEQGEKAVATTNHGNMIKSYELYKECKSKGIKPIIGCEFYCGEKEDTNRFHLVLIAKNNTGLKNLYKLVRKSYDLFYSKPRISMEDIRKHSEGLICLSACLGGEIAKTYNKNEHDALDIIKIFKSIFDEDFYLEIQPNNIEDQVNYNLWVQSICYKYGIKPVVTCDCHYINKEDYESHDTLICMQIGKKKDDKERFRFRTKDAYLKTDEEVKFRLTYLKSEFVQICINNTYLIADKCEVSIEYENLMPSLPNVTDEDLQLAKLCTEGFKKRLQEGAFEGLDTKQVIDRIYYELSVLKEKGYSGYFLILEDFYRFCEENEIPTGVGRGSCAGSEVAFIIGLTEVEPIRYGLLFERFLNPSRNSPPDL